jgi:hypothetical protein
VLAQDQDRMGQGKVQVPWNVGCCPKGGSKKGSTVWLEQPHHVGPKVQGSIAQVSGAGQADLAFRTWARGRNELSLLGSLYILYLTCHTWFLWELSHPTRTEFQALVCRWGN